MHDLVVVVAVVGDGVEDVVVVMKELVVVEVKAVGEVEGASGSWVAMLLSIEVIQLVLICVVVVAVVGVVDVVGDEVVVVAVVVVGAEVVTTIRITIVHVLEQTWLTF